MDQWIVSALLGAVGVLGQWWVGSRASARRDGKIDEQLRSHEARLLKHGEEIDDLRTDSAEDRGRILVLETKAGVRVRG